jgi:ABC-type Fe3+/spermidine/putrescine transport system ATPase subunit
VKHLDSVGVRADSIVHRYDTVDVLKRVTLDVQPGEFLTLLGASGSGKSTLLQAIAGLIQPHEGRIFIQGTDVTRLAPERRQLGYVFQNYALFPHLTVADNVAFPLKMRGVARSARRQPVMEALELTGLSALANRFPGQLSGGQQQRVALARAIPFQPRVLLLDEPLGALDRQLRQQLGLELRRLQRSLGITAVYVTHDQEEAFSLSSRVAVMDAGNILQVGTPEEVYRTPRSLFVAAFLGDLNAIPATVVDRTAEGAIVRVGDLRLTGRRAQPVAIGADVVAGIRPEHLTVEDPEQPSTDERPSFDAVVEAAIFAGSWRRYELVLADGTRIHSVAPSSAPALAEGGRARVRYTPEHLDVFDPLTAVDDTPIDDVALAAAQPGR